MAIQSTARCAAYQKYYLLTLTWFANYYYYYFRRRNRKYVILFILTRGATASPRGCVQTCTFLCNGGRCCYNLALAGVSLGFSRALNGMMTGCVMRLAARHSMYQN